MTRAARLTARVALLASAGCAAAPSSPPAPVRYAVEVPPPTVAPASSPSPCPPGSSPDDGQCVRLVPSPEIPAWKPPYGADPCATLTSETGLIDCDPKNEYPPDAPDAGARPQHR